MIMNAPVGPPICTRLPPSAEIMKPAITAVIIPLFGDTPEAIPDEWQAVMQQFRQ